MAVARGLPGGAGDVPVCARPDARVPGVHLHGELRRVLRLGQGDRPGDVRGDPGAGRRGPLGGRRRLVGRAGLQHPVGRVVRAPRPVLAALVPGGAGRHGHGGLQRRPVRAQRDAAPAPAPRGHGLVRVHAPGPAREAAAEPGLLVGVAGRVASPRDAPAARVLLAARGPRLPPGQVARPAAGPVRRDDGVLRRGQPWRRADPREPGIDPGARRVALHAPSRSTARRSGSSPRCASAAPTTSPSSATTSSTTRWAATRRTRGSSAGTGARSSSWPRRRPGRRSPAGSRARPTHGQPSPRHGRPCCSTSSTTSSRARRSSPRTRRRATSWARHRRSPPAPTTWASSP